MADKLATKNGNWSDPTMWSGAAVPLPGDNVYSAGKTVTIDQNITAALLTNRRYGATGSVGGTFVCNAAWVINADVWAGGLVCLALNSRGHLNGNSTGGAATGAHGVVMYDGSVQHGNSVGGTGDYAVGSYLALGSLQRGNSEGGSFGNAHGSVLLSGSVQIGNGKGGTVSGAHGSVAYNGGRVTGNALGTVYAAWGVYAGEGGMFAGEATGGNVDGAHGAFGAAGSIMIVSKATGHSTVAWGACSVGTGQILVVDQQVGPYAKYGDAGTDETFALIPYAERPTPAVMAAAMWARVGRTLTP